jgi:hypothetical protein
MRYEKGEGALSKKVIWRASSKTKICDDKGSTCAVECLYRPCTYAIVACTTGVFRMLLLAQPDLADRDRKHWRSPWHYE